MDIEIQNSIPHDWKLKQGRAYDTRYIYIGFGRYDVEAGLFSRIERRDTNVLYHEAKHVGECFPRGYHVENVRVTVYSYSSPRVWSEEISPTEIYFFREKQQQDD